MAAHHSISKTSIPLSKTDFHSLGLRDLLDARDQFHVHLAHKPNVFSTAIGRYYIRDSEIDKGRPAEHAPHKRLSKAEPRTLLNSSIQDWSWPCILVFVRRWQTLEELRSQPEDVVPPFVYMPDGRIVPICVILAESANLPPRAIDPSRLDSTSLGIGSPIYVDAQGMRRMGTVACMVSDGSDFYVLTNAHLAGQVGRPVRALLRGVPEVVGTTLGTHRLTEKSFAEIYPSFPCHDEVVNLDAAIIRMDNVLRWDPDALPQPIGEVADFSASTASLSWIGQPVVAHGAASGEMRGEIKAIFYRYKSIGGRDYVADLVIGTRTGAGDVDPLVTQPGDSGALWCLDGVTHPKTRSPLALEWGGQRISSGPTAGEYLQFSLATSMAVILRELSLDMIHDPTAERTQYWGPVGHYKIGQQACFLVKDGALKGFFTANINNLSFSTDKDILAASLQASHFVPLSDVPDVVWKTNINRVKRAVTRPMENWNHYADIDLPGKDGQTLLQNYLASEDSLNWKEWIDFYKTAPLPSAATSNTRAYGALPFRVWQIFAQLVGYAKASEGPSFLTAAGCLAHYVGDACQPLHGSQHADGLNGASTGVHSTYEDNMVNAFQDQIAAGFAEAADSLSFKPRTISSPRDAAFVTMDLMNFCNNTLPPETICQVYNQARPGSPKSATKDKAVLQALWDNCGEQTITVIAAGAVTLAALWDAAWRLGRLGKPQGTVAWLSTTYDGAADLQPIYEGTDFLRSLHLPYLGQADLPGSDAPKNPPSPPAKMPPSSTDDRGHK
jgi:hypothetical protein